MKREKASQEQYNSSIPYKSYCTKKTIPSAQKDQRDVPVHSLVRCLLPHCALGRASEGAHDVHLQGCFTGIWIKQEKHSTEDVSLLIYGAKNLEPWDMKEHVCVCTHI